MISDSKLIKAIQIINNAHNEDPVRVAFQEQEVGSEWLYSMQMVDCLKWYHSEDDQMLELTVLCHHLKRWEIARDDFPMDKQGYFQWRRHVAKHQLNIASSLLQAAGFTDEEIGKVIDVLRKENIKKLPESQIVEDVACLVFVQFYLEDFAKPHAEEKVVDILYKTMLKMSDKAIAQTASMSLSDQVKMYVNKASALLK